MAVAGNTKILSFFNPETVEETGKQSTNLNALIDEVTDQAYHSKVLEYPDFNCTVQKDLEKILPNVELEPAQIKSVIFSILSNAFDAIREKRSNAPKGYDPKVTITTRKLPRFVQVRIKDNGTGISFKDPKVIFEPFFTTKNGAQHAGLGLSEAYCIMTVVHKGELLVESDSGQGTDIIIRFPIATIM
jgi:signal transduction histidine kinase